MRSPGGLARLANIAGDYVYVVYIESFVDPKLKFLGVHQLAYIGGDAQECWTELALDECQQDLH